MTYSLAYQVDQLDEKVTAAAEEMGDDVPEGIANKPELDDYQTWMWNSYCDLGTSRVGSFVPWNLIEEYCDRQGIEDLDDRADFRYLIRKLDRKYAELMKEKRKRDLPAAPQLIRR